MIDACGTRLCQCRFGAKALVGDLGRLLLGFVLVSAPLRFMCFARFCFPPFLFFSRFFDAENVGIHLGALALLNLDQFGFAKCAGAGADFRLSERAQDDAGFGL